MWKQWKYEVNEMEKEQCDLFSLSWIASDTFEQNEKSYNIYNKTNAKCNK